MAGSISAGTDRTITLIRLAKLHLNIRMDTTNANPPFDDEEPFVREECGDTMWDEVLAQPPYNPSLRPPVTPFTLESNKDPKENGPASPVD